MPLAKARHGSHFRTRPRHFMLAGMLLWSLVNPTLRGPTGERPSLGSARATDSWRTPETVDQRGQRYDAGRPSRRSPGRGQGLACFRDGTALGSTSAQLFGRNRDEHRQSRRWRPASGYRCSNTSSSADRSGTPMKGGSDRWTLAMIRTGNSRLRHFGVAPIDESQRRSASTLSGVRSEPRAVRSGNDHGRRRQDTFEQGNRRNGDRR